MTTGEILHYLRNPWGHDAVTLRTARLEGADEIERLRAALKRYGKHDGDCLYDDSTYNDGPWPCTCGFSEALRGIDSAADMKTGNQDE